jgi:DNA-binding beta-propeller fold protein YncE
VYDGEGEKLYVTNKVGVYLYVIDTRDFILIRRIPMIGGGYGIGATMDGRNVIVTHPFKSSVSIINSQADEVLRVIKRVGAIPVSVVVDELGDVYIGDCGEPVVTRIKALKGKEITKIKTSKFLRKMGSLEKGFIDHMDMALLRKSNLLFILDPYSKDIYMIDLLKQQTEDYFPVSSGTIAMAMSENEELLGLVNEKGNYLRISRRSDLAFPR